MNRKTHRYYEKEQRRALAIRKQKDAGRKLKQLLDEQMEATEARLAKKPWVTEPLTREQWAEALYLCKQEKLDRDAVKRFQPVPIKMGKHGGTEEFAEGVHDEGYGYTPGWLAPNLSL